MNETKENLMGALTGAATAALTSYIRNEDDLERRLRNARDDAEEALDLIREMNSHGGAVRSRLPIVSDAQVGLSIASPQQTAPAVVPGSAPSTRPDLTSAMEGEVADLSWPPQPGEYTDRGLVKQAGELTALFLALTYEEVRAFVLGLTQSRSPSRDGKVQLFYMANTLSQVVTGLRLTSAQYREAWTRLFTGQSLPSAPPPAAPSSSVDLHRDPSRPPSIAAFDASVASVMALGRPEIPAHPYEHRNTDRCMKFRVVAPTGLQADSMFLAVNFGSEYRSPDGRPIQPAVGLQDGRFCIRQITSTGFQVAALGAIPAGTHDLFISSVGG